MQSGKRKAFESLGDVVLFWIPASAGMTWMGGGGRSQWLTMMVLVLGHDIAIMLLVREFFCRACLTA